MAYYTIFVPKGLSSSEYRRAARAGRPGVTSGKRTQNALLRSAGFARIAEEDVTAEYLRIARGLLAARERNAAALRRSVGAAWLAERTKNGRAQVAAIEAGLLRRSLLVAERPR